MLGHDVTFSSSIVLPHGAGKHFLKPDFVPDHHDYDHDHHNYDHHHHYHHHSDNQNIALDCGLDRHG